MEYATNMLKEYFIRESRIIREAHRTELVTLLYVANASQITGDLQLWLKQYQQI